jgi:hypothetical protein
MCRKEKHELFFDLKKYGPDFIKGAFTRFVPLVCLFVAPKNTLKYLKNYNTWYSTGTFCVARIVSQNMYAWCDNLIPGMAL